MNQTIIFLCLALMVTSNIIQGAKATKIRRRRAMSMQEWEILAENQSKVTYMEAEEMVAAQMQFNISTLERAMGLTLENCARLQQTCEEKYKNKTKHQQTSKP